MKRLILTATVFVLGITATLAQTQQKTATTTKNSTFFKKKNNNSDSQNFQAYDLFVSGTILYAGEKISENSRNNRFTFSPKLGFFVNDNIAVGLNLNTSSRKSESNSSATLSADVTRNFSVGGFGRYYCSKSRFSLFGQLGIDYLSRKTETTTGIIVNNNATYDTTLSKQNGINLGLSAGANYFISSNFALETSIGFLNYNSVKANVPAAKPVTNFSLGIDLTNINFGLLYKF